MVLLWPVDNELDGDFRDMLVLFEIMVDELIMVSVAVVVAGIIDSLLEGDVIEPVKFPVLEVRISELAVVDFDTFCGNVEVRETEVITVGDTVLFRSDTVLKVVLIDDVVLLIRDELLEIDDLTVLGR